MWSGGWSKGQTITVSEDVRGKYLYIKGTSYLAGILMPVQIKVGVIINWYQNFHLFEISSNDGKQLYCADTSWGISEVWIQD